MYENSGGECDDYSWSQTDKEVTCEIRLTSVYEKYVSSIRNRDPQTVDLHNVKGLIKVEIRANNVAIFVGNECIFSQDLYLDVSTEHSTWYVEKTRACGRDVKGDNTLLNLVILLVKRRSSLWSKCFKGDDEIDLSRVASTKRFCELDDKAKMDIMRTVVCGGKDNRKSAGADVHEILREAWNKENSPFKDTEYDPELARKMLGHI